jgi:hypothetical protein
MRLLWSILALWRGVPVCADCGRPKTPLPMGVTVMGWICLVCYEATRKRVREKQER